VAGHNKFEYTGFGTRAHLTELAGLNSLDRGYQLIRIKSIYSGASKVVGTLPLVLLA
jgi:hypothetical protein